MARFYCVIMWPHFQIQHKEGKCTSVVFLVTGTCLLPHAACWSPAPFSDLVPRFSSRKTRGRANGWFTFCFKKAIHLPTLGGAIAVISRQGGRTSRGLGAQGGVLCWFKCENGSKYLSLRCHEGEEAVLIWSLVGWEGESFLQMLPKHFP